MYPVSRVQSPWEEAETVASTKTWLVAPPAGDYRLHAEWEYGEAELLDRESVGTGWSSLWLAAPALAALSRGGHYVMLGTNAIDPYLKLPFYVAAVKPAQGHVQVLWREGNRTAAFIAPWHPGQVLQHIGPLGTGFPDPASFAGPLLLVGAGHGLAPLALAAGAARAAGHAVALANPGLPSDSPDWSALAGEGVAPVLGLGPLAQHLDSVRELIQRGGFQQVWAAGPEPLLAAVARCCGEAGVAGYVAVERHIACGVGTCLGCVVKTPAGGTWRICVDGPVLPAGAVMLDG